MINANKIILFRDTWFLHILWEVIKSPINANSVLTEWRLGGVMKSKSPCSFLNVVWILKQHRRMLLVFIQGFVCAFDRYRLSPAEESILPAFSPPPLVWISSKPFALLLSEWTEYVSGFVLTDLQQDGKFSRENRVRQIPRLRSSADSDERALLVLFPDYSRERSWPRPWKRVYCKLWQNIPITTVGRSGCSCYIVAMIYVLSTEVIN